MNSVSQSLLERVRARDDAAWQRLVDLYRPLIVGWCRRCGLDEATANDVTQETFAAVARSIDRFRRDRPGDTFRGWLRTIARNKIREHFRKLGDAPLAVGGSTANLRLQQLTDEELEDSMSGDLATEIQNVYRRALEIMQSGFEERTWKAFWQSAIEQRSAADIARDLGMSPGAVRQAKYKVLRQLREELGPVLEMPAS